MFWNVYFAKFRKPDELRSAHLILDVPGVTDTMADCRAAIMFAAKEFGCDQENLLCTPMRPQPKFQDDAERDGVAAILFLQSLNDTREPIDLATKNWRAFSKHEKEQTMMAQKYMLQALTTQVGRG